MRTTFFDDGGTSLLMLVVYSKCGAALMSGLRRRSAPFPSRCRLVSGQGLSPLLQNPLSQKFLVEVLDCNDPHPSWQSVVDISFEPCSDSVYDVGDTGALLCHLGC